MPDPWGRPGAKGGAGPLSKQARLFFGGAPGQIVCEVSKAQPAIWRGNRNPVGLELWSAAAERGNYPEAKPDGEVLKEGRSCKYRRSPMFCAKLSYGMPLSKSAFAFAQAVYHAEVINADARRWLCFRKPIRGNQSNCGEKSGSKRDQCCRIMQHGGSWPDDKHDSEQSDQQADLDQRLNGLAEPYIDSDGNE